MFRIREVMISPQKEGRGVYSVATAREMDEAERRRYERAHGG